MESPAKYYACNFITLFRLLLLAVAVVLISRSPGVEARDAISSSTSFESSILNDRGIESTDRIPRRSFHQRKYREARSEKNRQRRLRSQQQERKLWLQQHQQQQLDDGGDQNQDDGERKLNVFAHAVDAQIIYVNANTGDDSKDGTSPFRAVKTLKRALELVEKVARPLKSDLIVELTGTFEMGERLLLTRKHKGTNKNKRVVFRGGDGNGNGNPARVLGGKPLEFVKVSSLDDDHPAKKLAELAGVDMEMLLAAPPPEGFPSSANENRWTDGDCRDTNNYVSPPTLTINGKRVLTRAREPNLPARTVDPEDEEGMGEVLDTWLRTLKKSNDGITYFNDSDRASVDKASNASWNSGSVTMHIFPRVDWFDARIPVGKRFSNRFEPNTTQKGAGDPNRKKFKIVPEARYYLEGAIEYLDYEGEYFVSLGETVEDSYGWTLLYPPSDIKNTNFSAVLSLSKKSLFKTTVGDDMFVAVENIHFEASKRLLGDVYGNNIEFKDCKFINAGFDGIEVWGQNVSFRNCVIEGTGGSSIRMGDDRDIDTDGYDFALLLSGNSVVDSLLSDFASTCRHYSEAVALGGFGTIISNNHFRSSNMAAIDLVGGGTQIKHNIFSHISDGSYDDGAIHWVASSPMERGTEVSYNVFFRNGVSKEPCNAETSCYQADIYMDDSAGAMIINGNVMIKDKILQTKPPSNKFAPIQWLGILINGGADITTYDNTYFGPVDDNDPQQSAIYRGGSALYEQTCGGTIFTDEKECGYTGICKNNEFYSLMRQYKYTQSPWTEIFPELSKYDANPSNKANPRCSSQPSCPVAAWNQTVICNAAIGSNREFAHKAVWPTDPYSELFGEAKGGKNAPFRNEALVEKGNKPGSVFDEDSVAVVDAVEKQGVREVIEFAKRVAAAGEASYQTGCEEGTRRGGARLELAGRLGNPCIGSWIADGVESCDPCTLYSGTIVCAPRDLPLDGKCSCNYEDGGNDPPTPSPPPMNPTLQPTVQPPTPAPTKLPSCLDDPDFRFKKWNKSDCKWSKKNGKCDQKYKESNKFVREFCPKSCDFCPEGCTNCEEPLEQDFTVYTKQGYCKHQSDKETKKSVGSRKACWEQCQLEYNREFAEFTDGTCFCTKKCPCMGSVGNNDIVAIVPNDFELPGEC